MHIIFNRPNEEPQPIRGNCIYTNDQCKLYYDQLIRSGLMHKVNNGDKRTTPKCGRFLSCYDQMKELLPVGMEENLADDYYHLNTSLNDRLEADLVSVKHHGI